MLEGWLGHCLNKTASSRVGHVFRAGRWVLLSSLDFDVLELFAFSSGWKGYSQEVICQLIGAVSWDTGNGALVLLSQCLVGIIVRCYASLICRFDWHAVTALHFTFVSLLWYYIEGTAFPITCTAILYNRSHWTFSHDSCNKPNSFVMGNCKSSEKTYGPKCWPFWRLGGSQEFGVLTSAFQFEVFPVLAFQLVLVPVFVGWQVSDNLLEDEI